MKKEAENIEYLLQGCYDVGINSNMIKISFIKVNSGRLKI